MFNFLRKHRRLFLIAAMAATGVFLVPAKNAMADVSLWTGFTNPAETAVYAVGKIISLYVQGIGKLAVMMIGVLIKIAQYNDFVKSSAVENGWVIIRDVVNMFFIIILLVIAFATIFNVKEYKYQAMLPRLLIMAVVINFSRTICGILIDFGQVVMLTFVNGFQAAAGGNFVNALKINDLLAFDPNASPTDTSIGYIFAAFILAALAITITLVVLVVMVMMLIMRIVALWFLIILSPIAFLASVWPSGRFNQKYALWWDMFLDNIVVGPLLAFFLWLSLLVLGQGTVNTEIVPSGGAGAEGDLKASVTKIGSFDNMVSYLMGIGMLLGSLAMAQGMRSAGAGIAGAALGKMKGYASAAVRKPISLAGRGIKAGVKRGAEELYRGTGVKRNVEHAWENLRASGFGRVVMPTKEQKDERDVKDKIKEYKSTGLPADAAKAEQLQNTLAMRMQKKYEEEGVNTSVARQRLKMTKKGSAEEEALAMIVASSGTMKHGEFRGYGINRDNQDSRRVEERLRGAAYKAGDKDAFLGWSDNPALSVNPLEQLQDTFRQHKNPGEQRAYLRNIKTGAQIGVDGKQNDEFAPEKLSMVNPDYFEKMDAEMQRDIMDSIILTVENLQKTNPAKITELGLADKLEKFVPLAKDEAKPMSHPRTAYGLPTTPGPATNAVEYEAGRKQHLIEEQNLVSTGKEATAYVTATLDKSDLDSALENIVKNVSAGDPAWVQTQMSAILRATNGVSTIRTQADAVNMLAELRRIRKELRDKATQRDTNPATRVTGQHKKDGSEMNNVEVLEGGRLYKNLGDAEQLVDGMRTSGVEDKKKKAASQKVSIAARYMEDASGVGMPKEAVRPFAKHPKSFYGTVKDYYVAEARARNGLDKILDTADAGKRVKQLKTQMAELRTALRIVEKDAKRFSPAVSTDVQLVKQEIERLLQVGANVGKADIDGLNDALEKIRDRIAPVK